jgi:NAD(P)-dependent dehydrogenase (short-subunit alcohol dehydrogenase family)
MSTGTGRGVLVTGASRGIGSAVARMFADAGDRVAVHYGSSAVARSTPPRSVSAASTSW